MAKHQKRFARKVTSETLLTKAPWSVVFGELRRGRGRPGQPLFKVVAEKLPFDDIDVVRKHLASQGVKATGVYMAHDSMGIARYVGRGNIFQRLKARKKAQDLELAYFSFYIGMNKTHEREVETVLIRCAGPQAHFNSRKKRVDIQAGNIRDYEAGTLFYQRQYRRGRPRT